MRYLTVVLGMLCIVISQNSTFATEEFTFDTAVLGRRVTSANADTEMISSISTGYYTDVCLQNSVLYDTFMNAVANVSLQYSIQYDLTPAASSSQSIEDIIKPSLVKYTPQLAVPWRAMVVKTVSLQDLVTVRSLRTQYTPKSPICVEIPSDSVLSYTPTVIQANNVECLVVVPVPGLYTFPKATYTHLQSLAIPWLVITSPTEANEMVFGNTFSFLLVRELLSHMGPNSTSSSYLKGFFVNVASTSGNENAIGVELGRFQKGQYLRGLVSVLSIRPFSTVNASTVVEILGGMQQVQSGGSSGLDNVSCLQFDVPQGWRDKILSLEFFVADRVASSIKEAITTAICNIESLSVLTGVECEQGKLTLVLGKGALVSTQVQRLHTKPMSIPYYTVCSLSDRDSVFAYQFMVRRVKEKNTRSETLSVTSQTRPRTVTPTISLTRGDPYLHRGKLLIGINLTMSDDYSPVNTNRTMEELLQERVRIASQIGYNHLMCDLKYLPPDVIGLIGGLSKYAQTYGLNVSVYYDFRVEINFELQLTMFEQHLVTLRNSNANVEFIVCGLNVTQIRSGKVGSLHTLVRNFFPEAHLVTSIDSNTLTALIMGIEQYNNFQAIMNQTSKVSVDTLSEEVAVGMWGFEVRVPPVYRGSDISQTEFKMLSSLGRSWMITRYVTFEHTTEFSSSQRRVVQQLFLDVLFPEKIGSFVELDTDDLLRKQSNENIGSLVLSQSEVFLYQINRSMIEVYGDLNRTSDSQLPVTYSADANGILSVPPPNYDFFNGLGNLPKNCIRFGAGMMTSPVIPSSRQTITKYFLRFFLQTYAQHDVYIAFCENNNTQFCYASSDNVFMIQTNQEYHKDYSIELNYTKLLNIFGATTPSLPVCFGLGKSSFMLQFSSVLIQPALVVTHLPPTQTTSLSYTMSEVQTATVSKTSSRPVTLTKFRSTADRSLSITDSRSTTESFTETISLSNTFNSRTHSRSYWTNTHEDTITLSVTRTGATSSQTSRVQTKSRSPSTTFEAQSQSFSPSWSEGTRTTTATITSTLSRSDNTKTGGTPTQSLFHTITNTSSRDASTTGTATGSFFETDTVTLTMSDLFVSVTKQLTESVDQSVSGTPNTLTDTDTSTDSKTLEFTKGTVTDSMSVSYSESDLM
eukprot:PhF_6_TR42972/c1_g1_i2/m.65426